MGATFVEPGVVVVNFWGFLVVTRTPVVGFGRKQVGMSLASPPDLSKQPRTLKNDQRTPTNEKEKVRTPVSTKAAPTTTEKPT